MAEVTELDAEKRAASALTASPYFALRGLTVEQAGDCLRLRGTVRRFYDKQLAQETVRSVTKGYRLVNQVRVE